MKKATSLLVVLAMFMSASCGALLKDEEEAGSTSLVGTWTASDSDGTMTLVFKDDGTYAVGGNCPETGSWSDNGSTFTITTTYIGGDTESCGTASGEPDTMNYSMAGDGKSFTISGTGESGTGTTTFYRQ